MDKLDLLEATLARYTPRDRAFAIIGDLLEAAQAKGQLWFWTAYVRILSSLAWRVPAAWFGAYAIGASLMAMMMTHDPFWTSADFRSITPSGPIATAAWCVVTMPAVPLWFVAPYAALRFGLCDRFSQLAIALFSVAMLALLFGRYSPALVTGAALFIVAVIAAVFLREWRKPMVALGLTIGTAIGGLVGLLNLTERMIDHHPDWSDHLHWLLVRVAMTLAFILLSSVCSLMHSLLKRPIRRFVTVAVVSSMLSGSAFAWAANSDSVFAVADIHSSPFRRDPEVRGGVLAGNRYELRDATMVDLISKAYGIEAQNVVGGPSWLEWDRFDIFASANPAASPDDLKDMLRGLLADRFKLITHTDTRPQQAFVLTVGKDKLRLKKGSGEPGCTAKQLDSAAGLVEASCHNVTMESLAKVLPRIAGAYVTNSVVDSTGLNGTWDVDIKWTAKAMLAKAGSGGISFFDALSKQLGLQLAPGTAPLPVLVVDRVNKTPTPNVPDLARLLPHPLPPQFEVSIIKPSKPDTEMDGDLSGGQMEFQGATLDVLIRAAWDLPDKGPMLQGAPKWLTEDKYDIVAKAPRESSAPELDQDDLRPMLQTLLANRFKLVVHTEEQTMDAYNLVAANPKMKKADSATRTRCFQGPAPHEKDPRFDNPILNRLNTCQGVSMAQFAEQIQTLAPGYVKTPVLDATHIEGAYNLTVNYTGAAKLIGNPGTSAPAGDAAIASDPSGGLSLFDALPKQLGLKLEKVKRSVPVLVIDHVEEKPTEN